MGWFDDVTEFVTDNSSWLKPVANAGVQLFNQNTQDTARNEYQKYLMEKEKQNYQNSVDTYNAYQEYLKTQGGGSGGRGGGSNQGAKNAASKKALKAEQDAIKKNKALYQPFADTALRLLPQKTKMYEDSLGQLSQMSQLLASPEQRALLTASRPASSVNIPLPDYLKR